MKTKIHRQRQVKVLCQRRAKSPAETGVDSMSDLDSTRDDQEETPSLENDPDDPEYAKDCGGRYCGAWCFCFIFDGGVDFL